MLVNSLKFIYYYSEIVNINPICKQCCFISFAIVAGGSFKFSLLPHMLVSQVSLFQEMYSFAGNLFSSNFNCTFPTTLNKTLDL